MRAGHEDAHDASATGQEEDVGALEPGDDVPGKRQDDDGEVEDADRSPEVPVREPDVDDQVDEEDDPADEVDRDEEAFAPVRDRGDDRHEGRQDDRDARAVVPPLELLGRLRGDGFHLHHAPSLSRARAELVELRISSGPALRLLAGRDRGSEVREHVLDAALLDARLRLDEELFDDTVLEDRGVALRALAEPDAGAIHDEVHRLREVAVAIADHLHRVADRLVFGPRVHHERVVDGDTGDQVDAICLHLVGAQHEPGKVEVGAAGCERAGDGEQHDLARAEQLTRLSGLRHAVVARDRHRDVGDAVADLDGHASLFRSSWGREVVRHADYRATARWYAPDVSGTSHTLVRLRHGQSEWNLANLFTGWVDVGLSDQGRDEAASAGVALRDAGVEPDVLHTSLQKRAIHTAELALLELDRSWIPVRRSWRLNERHYGALQGKDKKQTTDEFGADQVKIWRRSYDTRPPPLEAPALAAQTEDPRYANLPPEALPASECLADVVDRMMPYWTDDVVPDLEAGSTVLIAAHGNSLRALVKHLDGISDADIVELNIPTGVPLVYELDDRLGVLDKHYLGDQAAIDAATAAVAGQAG